ncbi:MAG: outer membrane beta-barrel domain-containing protein [Deltaproteobacteria bacterium]|nr:outer membrane beta-barrel domain-containing protein [Deltaproteobacteria bacterium]
MSTIHCALRVFPAASVLVLGLASGSAIAESPAQEAVRQLSAEKTEKNVVQNRFFLKEARFEVSPVLGYVPNNPFSRRFLGGLLVGYHLSESFAAEGAILYSPDLGRDDLKGLTGTLVTIAHQGDPDVQFQQPIDKMILGATFAARWAPVYGKINLLGESVLNFDLYGTGGIGLLSIAEYYATYNQETAEAGDPVQLSAPQSKVKVPVNLGIGLDFFASQSVAIKIDARTYLYVDRQPDYNPDANNVLSKRLYNTFIASAGVSVFMPRMKSRIVDF